MLQFSNQPGFHPLSVCQLLLGISCLSWASGLVHGKLQHQQQQQQHRILCSSWWNDEIREQRVRPYLSHLNSNKAAAENELARICSSPKISDIAALQALRRWLDSRPSTTTVNPFTPSYYALQAQQALAAWDVAPAQKAAKGTITHPHILDYGCGDGSALTWLHGKRGFPSTVLHCIEVFDMPPQNAFQRHVLKDPIADLQRLAAGRLKSYFHVTWSAAVFHHMPDPTVRNSVLTATFEMARPGSIFLLSDWDNLGKASLTRWYDASHWLLWIFMGMQAPEDGANLAIGTLYANIPEYTALFNKAGWTRMLFHGNNSTDKPPDPTGGFSTLFERALPQP